MRNAQYTSKTDVVAQVILPALGENADDFDIDAIFDAAFGWDDEGHLVQTVSSDEFWQIVEAHDISE